MKHLMLLFSTGKFHDKAEGERIVNIPKRIEGCEIAQWNIRLPNGTRVCILQGGYRAGAWSVFFMKAQEPECLKKDFATPQEALDALNAWAEGQG